jgi:hypothetical protein
MTTALVELLPPTSYEQPVRHPGGISMELIS